MPIFLITIQTQNTQKEWDYEPNTTIIVPVKSNNWRNALAKFENEKCGSEYPDYEIKSYYKCEEGLFKPML